MRETERERERERKTKFISVEMVLCTIKIHTEYSVTDWYKKVDDFA